VEELENSRAVVLDTDILIDLLRNKKEAGALISEMEKKGVQFFTTAVNAHELFYGAHKSTHKKESLLATRRLLRRIPILHLTLRSAQKSGRILAELEAKGQSTGIADVLVAAIALTRGYGLATRNGRHFRRIDGLNVVATEDAK
jgi:tRNA(fMet)-specific endonuclease VapC